MSVIPQLCLPQGCRSEWKQPGKAKSAPQGAADLGAGWRTARRCFDLRVWEPPVRGWTEASLPQCNN